MSTLIQIKKVWVRLGKQVQALDSVSVQIPKGKIIGFIGPSGAGKTTLIRSIVGRQKLTDGQISIMNLPAGSSKLRSEMSYMTQEPAIYSDLTVKENLTYFAKMLGFNRSQLEKEITRILKVVDLEPQANQLSRNLSGGQRQRVSLAIALIGSPKILVLDEPTVGLDPVLREQIWSLFRKLVEDGSTIIVSSHVMDEAERCDELLLLRGGQVLAYNSPAGLCRETGAKNVEQSFLKLVRES